MYEGRRGLNALIPTNNGALQSEVWDILCVARVERAKIIDMVTDHRVGSVALSSELDADAGREATLFVEHGALGDSGCPVVTSFAIEIEPLPVDEHGTHID